MIEGCDNVRTRFNRGCKINCVNGHREDHTKETRWQSIVKLIDKLLADYKKPEDIIGENGLLKQLTKALLERAMQAEMTEHLGYEKHDPAATTAATRAMARRTKR